MKIFDKVMIFLLTSSLFAVVWHFGDVYGTDFTFGMPLALLLKIFLSYWGTKVLISLAVIYGIYFIFLAIGRWHQSVTEKAVEKALNKYL